MVDYNGFWDTVIEVIDLEAGRTIARERLDDNLIRFLGSHEVMGRTYLEGMTVRLPIYRLRLDSQPEYGFQNPLQE